MYIWPVNLNVRIGQTIMKKCFTLFLLLTAACFSQPSKTWAQAVTPAAEKAKPGKSDAGGPATKDQVIGFWKMIELPGLSKVNPWPLPYQWFGFYADGKVYSMMSSTKEEEYTAASLDELFKILPADGTPTFKIKGQFMTIKNPGGQNELWGVNLFAKDVGSVAKKGDLMMTLDDGSGNVIYYRLLRRVE